MRKAEEDRVPSFLSGSCDLLQLGNESIGSLFFVSFILCVLSAPIAEIQCGQVRYKLTAEEYSEGGNGVKKMLLSINCFFCILCLENMSGLVRGSLWLKSR